MASRLFPPDGAIARGRPRTPISDSDQAVSDIRGLIRLAWARRDLVGLLARRELTARYRRSALGVLWTLIPPVAQACALWLVFSTLFRVPPGGVPYAVYVFSGSALVGFVSSSLLAAAGTTSQNAILLRRLPVRAELLAIASAAGSGIAFAALTGLLIVLQLATGEGVPATALLLPVLGAVMLATVIGLGLGLAAFMVRFYDAIEVVRVGLMLAVFLSPVFYPLTVVPERYKVLIEANPITHALLIYRGFAYEGRLAPWWAFAGVGATAVVACVVGPILFSRARAQMVLTA